MWILSQQKDMLTDGNLYFILYPIDIENNGGYHIMLHNVPVASYTKRNIAIFVLVMLANYLNESDKNSFKFPSEEQAKEMMKQCTKK